MAFRQRRPGCGQEHVHGPSFQTLRREGYEWSSGALARRARFARRTCSEIEDELPRIQRREDCQTQRDLANALMEVLEFETVPPELSRGAFANVSDLVASLANSVGRTELVYTVIDCMDKDDYPRAKRAILDAARSLEEPMRQWYVERLDRLLK